MSARPRVLVRVPATSANLGPGFDTLGLAVEYYDEVEVELSPDAHTRVDVTGVGAGVVPTDEANLVVRAIQRVYDEYARQRPALVLRCHNVIPHSRGLGSSASAIVSGVLAARELLRGDVEISDQEAFRLAHLQEGHPDNVAPALVGGLTISWVNSDTPHTVRVPVHPDILPLVLVPDYTSSTREARRLVPDVFPRADVVHNLSRVALLVEALTRSPGMLLDATEDVLHQPYREPVMRPSAALVAQLRDAGHAAVISGAGPSVLVLCTSEQERARVAAVAQQHPSTRWERLMLAIDHKGATVETR
ncbi:MAG TPA: homoserine kinase [Pseudoclavibacter sp.]|nr:homoserine kinase [Pseudoclavibacter sp.]